MIAPQKCEQIRELLLANQYSLRSIARQMNVSPATVGRIARRRKWPTKVAAEEFLITPIRCPSCGGHIEVTPCRLCRARQVTEQKLADRHAARRLVERMALAEVLRQLRALAARER